MVDRHEDRPGDDERPVEPPPDGRAGASDAAPPDEASAPPATERAVPETPGADERLLNVPAPIPEPPPSPPPLAPEPEPPAATEDVPAAGEAAPAPSIPPPLPPPPGLGSRRLMRSRTQRVIGGVAGGIADRTDTDPGLVRVLFIVVTLLTAGLGLLLYVVLWLSMPLEPAGGSSGATPEERARHAADHRVGGLILGLLLVVAGVLWLLEATDAVDLDWSVALAGILIGIGALLILTLGRVGRGALITLGVVVAAALAVTSLVDVNFESGFGDRTEEPASITELQREYSHAFGSMTLDLRSVQFPEGTTRIKASTSFGSLRVRLPEGVPVRIDAETVFGSINALGTEASGAQADRILTEDSFDTATRRIELEVDAAFGSVEVRR